MLQLPGKRHLLRFSVPGHKTGGAAGIGIVMDQRNCTDILAGSQIDHDPVFIQGVSVCKGTSVRNCCKIHMDPS